MKLGKWRQLDLFHSRVQRTEPHRNRGGEGDITDHCQRISSFLTVVLPEPVDLTFTTNRSTMISYSRRAGRLALRLHRVFRHADDELLQSLALFLSNKNKKASMEINRFIAAHKDEVRVADRGGRGALKESGKYHDLGLLLHRVSRSYFGGKVDVRIGWGRAPSRNKKRRRTGKVTRSLATYSYDDKVIRVSPVLDAPDVPDYVLEWIVYHELLHHVLPAEVGGARNLYHTKRFRALEHGFARYEEAKAWESANLDRLLL